MKKKGTLSLGQKIRELRKKRGLTQVELAVIVNISPVYLGFIENARRLPSLKTLKKLARALKVKPSELIS